MRRPPALLLLLATAAALAGMLLVAAAEREVLQLEDKIPLGHVKGRIDHMAIDLGRRHLFVAELGNDSLGVVDLQTKRVVRRIDGLNEPQGVAFVPATDTLYIASAGDGSVRLFRGQDLTETGSLALGTDADNVRVDQPGGQVLVGYGQGALAVIDAEQAKKTGDITLNGHPEGFRLESTGSRIFVNVPEARSIEVIDRQAGKVVAKWSTGTSGGNFPMALDEASRRILVVFRRPATLAAFSAQDGSPVASAPTCGDADDVFADATRHRVYVSCGDGHLDVFEPQAGTFRQLARIPTVPGARTSLFVPELDRLLLAVRERDWEQAAIWIYRPEH
jgi:DNA-binding beta-propeller fold protein YncE